MKASFTRRSAPAATQAAAAAPARPAARRPIQQPVEQEPEPEQQEEQAAEMDQQPDLQQEEVQQEVAQPTRPMSGARAAAPAATSAAPPPPPIRRAPAQAAQAPAAAAAATRGRTVQPPAQTAAPAKAAAAASARQAPATPTRRSAPEMVDQTEMVPGNEAEVDEVSQEIIAVEAGLTVPTEMVQGQIDRSDISTPGLKIVQSVGPLSEMFDPGCVVLSMGGENSLPLTAAGQEQPLQLTVLRIRKQYVEDLPWGSEQRPRVFDFIEDVQAAGGWIEWHNNERPPFAKMATAMVMVTAPDDATEEELSHFPYEFDGGRFALALWTMRGAAYTSAAKAIFTASVYSLKADTGGLPRGAWNLTVKREKRGQNMVWVPVLKQGGFWDPELVQFFSTLAG